MRAQAEPMLKIGLTGGIGCGKTTVSNLFAAYGIPVLDADIIARELTAPGQPALAAMVREFGEHILENGHLNRKKLRDLIFQAPNCKQRLEEILHPLIYEAMNERMKKLQAPYCILVIPLLIETGRQTMVDRILVVDCPPEIQQRRVKRRDGLSDEVFDRIAGAQAPRAQKLAQASDIIENRESTIHLKEQVEMLHAAYLALARASSIPSNSID
jgi:dephospho-CoA kinase